MSRKSLADAGNTKEEERTTHAGRARLVTTTKYNLRYMLQPKSLILVFLSAFVSWFAVVTSIPFPSSPYFSSGLLQKAAWLVELHGGSEGLQPLFFVSTYYTQFTWFVIAGAPVVYYLSVCSLIAEDSGSLPAPLLFSRPVSRRAFLVIGFSIRFPIAVALGFVVPFVVGYAQVLGIVGGAIGSYVTGYMTMDAWYSMAFDGFFWSYMAVFVLCLFALVSIAALLTVASRRGVVSMPVATGIAFLLCAVEVIIIASHVSWNGSLPSFLALTPQYYLYGATMSTLGMYNPILNPVLTIGQGIPLLLFYGLAVLVVSALVYGRWEVAHP